MIHSTDESSITEISVNLHHGFHLKSLISVLWNIPSFLLFLTIEQEWNTRIGLEILRQELNMCYHIIHKEWMEIHYDWLFSAVLLKLK